MNVVVLTDSNSPLAGGVIEVVKQLALGICNNTDIDLSILSYSDLHSPNDLDGFNSQHMIDYHVSPLPILKTIGYSRDLSYLLNKINPDIIDSQGLWMFHSFATLQQKKKGVKTIVTPHGMLDSWAINNSTFKKRIAGWLYEYKNLYKADCLKALCWSEYKSIRSLGLKNPIAIIPNGIELPKVSRASNKNHNKTLLFLGRIHPKKGIIELLEGLSIVKRQAANILSAWEVRIAGWGPSDYLSQLETAIQTKGLEPFVHLIGPVFQNDKKEEFRQASAFVLTSFSEGLPMSVLEAWSYRLPVLMTEHCNLPEGFLAGGAIKVDTTPSSIANGLLQLFSMSDDELMNMGTNGFNLVCERFSWDKIAMKTKHLYEWVLNRDQKPDFVITD